jgi:hypothetical protein
VARIPMIALKCLILPPRLPTLNAESADPAHGHWHLQDLSVLEKYRVTQAAPPPKPQDPGLD